MINSETDETGETADAGLPPVAPVDNAVRSADDRTMEARVTKLEVHSEHAAKAIDTMQKRMDDGFRETRSSIDALQKRMDEGFKDAHKRMDEGFKDAHKRMDDGFKDVHKRMDDGYKDSQKRTDDALRELRLDMTSEFRAVRSEASANFRVIVGIQVTTLIALVTLLAKAAKIF